MQSRKILTPPFISTLVLLSCLACPYARAQGTWTALANAAPASVDAMLLLPDGTVLAANGYGGGSNWYRLTPDAQGSYLNGTWTTIAPMHDTRLYDASDVLTNGRLFVAGGYYGTGAGSAEIYDPLLNTWTLCSSGTGQIFSAAESVVLPDSTILVAPVYPNQPGQTAVYDPATDSWPLFPRLYLGFDQDEASWVTLPDNSILTDDPDPLGENPYSTNTERYIPSLNQWINDTPAPVPLYDDYLDVIGSFFLLPNSNVFCIGNAGYTALYTPSGSTNAGSWVAGPDEPSGLGSPEAPEAMLTDGHVLCAFGPSVTGGPPISFYEYDPVTNAFLEVNGPGANITGSTPPFETRMLDLPDGSVLFSDATSQLYEYEPSEAPLAAGAPAIASITTNYYGSYHLTGTLLNGISQGAADEIAQMNSNYPLVRMTNAQGDVYYARTCGWSSTGVMTGNLPVTTEFMVPQNLPGGVYSLVVVANGNSSAPVSFTFAPDTLQISALIGFGASGPNGGPAPAQSAGYTLTNAGASALNWAVGNVPAWLNVSPGNGAIANSGGTATVTISLNTAVAAAEPVGNYAATVWFTNLSTGAIQGAPFSYQSTPLVVNGGFEYGSFAYWTLSGNAGNSGIGDTATLFGQPAYVHSGFYAALLGDNTSPGYLSQTIPTVAGQSYALSFWLENISEATNSQFMATWNGTNLFEQASLGNLAYTNFQYVVAGASNDTVLQFSFVGGTNYFGLDDVTLTELTGPAIVIPPTNETVMLAGTATFTVQATGTPPLSYQWQFNGASLADATNTTLILTNVTTSLDGSYAVIVTNAYGSVTSAPALLNVIVPAGPSITVPPANQTVNAGGAATFTVQATGTAPLYYQWQYDGASIANATNAGLTLSNVTANQGGFYAVNVYDDYGSVTSARVFLTVLTPTIVQNGGFETGDFSFWNLSGNTNETAVVEDSLYTHSGLYGVQAGPYGSPVFISQTLATVPGQAYLISCWVDNPLGDTPNEFRVLWNGTNLVNKTNISSANWTEFQAIAVAAEAGTVLTFALQDNPAYLGLDDISAEPAPQPSFLASREGAGAIVFEWSALAGLGYQLQCTSDLQSNRWTNLGGAIIASNTVVTATDSLTNTQRFYRLLLLP